MTTPPPGPGDPAPPFELRDPEDRLHAPLGTSGSATPGALLAFFKDDCPTCRYTFPFLERIHRALAGRGGGVYGVAQDGRDRTRAFAREVGVGFPLLIDAPSFEVSRAYGVEIVPALFLVGSDGKVRRTLAGFRKAELAEIAREMAEGLGAPSPPVFGEGEQVLEIKPG